MCKKYKFLLDKNILKIFFKRRICRRFCFKKNYKKSSYLCLPLSYDLYILSHQTYMHTKNQVEYRQIFYQKTKILVRFLEQIFFTYARFQRDVQNEINNRLKQLLTFKCNKFFLTQSKNNENFFKFLCIFFSYLTLSIHFLFIAYTIYSYIP